MSGPSRTAGGAAVAPSAEMVDQFGARKVVFKSAQFMCAPAKGESVGITPSTTTTARADQPCRSPWPVTGGMRRGRGLLGGGVERLV